MSNFSSSSSNSLFLIFVSISLVICSTFCGFFWILFTLEISSTIWVGFLLISFFLFSTFLVGFLGISFSLENISSTFCVGFLWISFSLKISSKFSVELFCIFLSFGMSSTVSVGLLRVSFSLKIFSSFFDGFP